VRFSFIVVTLSDRPFSRGHENGLDCRFIDIIDIFSRQTLYNLFFTTIRLVERPIPPLFPTISRNDRFPTQKTTPHLSSWKGPL